VKERGHYEDLGVDVGIILQTDLQGNDGGPWTGLTFVKIEQVAEFCEHVIEHLVSIKCEEFIE